MKFFTLVVLTLVLSAGCNRPKEPSTTRGTTTVLVTESHLPLLKEEAAEFMRTYKDAKVLMAGTSTREAIVALLNDSVQCICVDREFNNEEKKVAEEAGIKLATVRFGRDALAVVVDAHGSLKSIKMKTLIGIIDGSITNWKKIPGSTTTGRLELVLTGRNSGTYELLQRGFFKLSKDLVPARIGTTEREIVDYVALNPKAVGIVSLAALIDNPKGVRILSVESPDSSSQEHFVQPSQSNIYEMLYPLSYSLYLYISEKRLGIGSGFSTFVRSMPGQKIIQNFGIVPEEIPQHIIQLNSE